MEGGSICAVCRDRNREKGRVRRAQRTEADKEDKCRKDRELKQTRRQGGLCTVCGSPVTGRYFICSTCRERAKLIQRARSARLTEQERLQRNGRERDRKQRLIEAGICLWCHEPLSEAFRFCSSCRKLRNEREGTKRAKLTEVEREKINAKERDRRKLRKEAGICPRCGRKTLGPYVHCTECRDRRKFQQSG